MSTGADMRAWKKQAIRFFIVFSLMPMLVPISYADTDATNRSISFSLRGVSTQSNNKSVKQVGIRGNVAPLSWDASIPLEKDGSTYRVTIDFPAGTQQLEFKFTQTLEDGQLVWEDTPNRIDWLVPDQTNTKRSPYTWNREQQLNVASLPMLQPEQLAADIALLETMVMDVHPGTSRYLSKRQAKHAITQLRAAFSQPITLGEAVLAVNALTAQIKCGHTMAGPYNQGPLVDYLLEKQADKLPFAFQWHQSPSGRTMLVTHDATRDGVLPPGSEIISIDGYRVESIHSALMYYMPSDGDTKKTKQAQMEVKGWPFERSHFDAFFAIAFPLSDRVEIRFRAPSASLEQSVEVQAVTKATRASRLTARYTDFPLSADDLWAFSMLDENLGLLTLNSFDLNSPNKITTDYQAFFAKTFRQLKQQKATHLIIDIRDNSGGNDEIVDALMRYLSFNRKAASKPAFVGKTRYQTFPDTLKPHITTWGESPWFYDLSNQKPKLDNVYYVFERAFSHDYPPALDDAFSGDIALLTGPANESLAFYLAHAIKRLDVGTIIGAETGGNMRGVNGGQLVFLTLPGSGIVVQLPVMGGFATETADNNGVQPDIRVEPTLIQLQNNEDVVLEQALSWTRQSSK